MENLSAHHGTEDQKNMAEDLSINKNKICSSRYANNYICRLCLKNEAHMEPLFYANLFPNILLTKKIYDCTSIQIIFERNLPMFVCKLCANKLDEYIRFRERCVANDEFLRNALAFFDAGQNIIKTEQELAPSSAQLQQHAGPIDFRQIKSAVDSESFEQADEDEQLETEQFSCNECDFITGDESTIRTHQKQHEDRPYACTMCSKSFKIRQHLLIHSHTHVDLQQRIEQSVDMKPTYSCSKCTKVFINRGNLINHSAECHGNVKNFSCEICFKSFKYNVQLRIHMRTHSGERPHTCEICHRGFSQLSNLRSHRKVHSKVKPYKCQLCLKSFTMLDNLSVHSLKCVKDKYRCTLCSKSFAKEGNLISHLQCHSEGVVEKNFKCEMCPKSFKNKEDWKRHVRVHTGEKPYICDICNKGFAQKANLLSHRKTHLKPEIVFKCERCDKVCRTQKLLEMHIQKCGTLELKTATPPVSELPTPTQSPMVSVPPPTSVTPTLEALSDLLRYEIAMRAPTELQEMLLATMEKKKAAKQNTTTGNRNYRCEVCFKVYSQYPSLVKHRKLHLKGARLRTKSTEADDRPYYCDICGKNFKFNRNLKVHMKLHTKSNGCFKCDKCSSTFELADQLKNHLLEHPIDMEKIFNCEFCSNTFKSNEDLKRHRRSHTGERPFKCDTCPKAFTQLSNLRAHTKIHEKKRTAYGCNICLLELDSLESLNVHLKTHQYQLFELCREMK
ncbi:zinc finger protein ZFP2-like isoform X2 [Topomyia yanbarensis]|uniref:zinc finger protein ZFP2-like isoform X2 n=1 Tax=Topomyia yanbarensis TaxID=2498891 RepID=UPI00273B179C|nr:zinc finger protein ZFP2-like isoform X2 [Topomyia yanbarensis]